MVFVTYFLVFLAVAMAGAVALLATGRFRSGGPIPWRPGEVSALDGLTEPTPNLPPVLLPEHPGPEDVDRLRFAVGFRGYRMDQVDQVLERLRDELAARDAVIQRLRSESADGGRSRDPGPDQ